MWEWDPEANAEVLVIDANPMLLINDPKVTKIVETLHKEGQSTVTKAKNSTKEVLEFLGVIVVKLCEILVEILL